MTDNVMYLNRLYIETNRYTIAVNVNGSRLTAGQSLTRYCLHHLSNLAAVSRFNDVLVDGKM